MGRGRVEPGIENKEGASHRGAKILEKDIDRGVKSRSRVPKLCRLAKKNYSGARGLLPPLHGNKP